jgi:hypothetical protein
MRRNAVRQRKKLSEPLLFLIAELLDVFPTFGPSDYRQHGQRQDV